MKKSEKILLIILVILGGALISTSYAFYHGAATGTANATVAKWSVKVKGNSLDTPAVKKLQFKDTDVKWENNPNVKEGVVAPGSKGKIDIEVDCTGTETSVEILTEASNDSNNKNVKVSVPASRIVVPLTDANKKRIVTIDIEWLNKYTDASNTGDMVLNGKIIKIPVKLTVKQVI